MNASISQSGLFPVAERPAAARAAVDPTQPEWGVLYQFLASAFMVGWFVVQMLVERVRR